MVEGRPDAGRFEAGRLGDSERRTLAIWVDVYKEEPWELWQTIGEAGGASQSLRLGLNEAAPADDWRQSSTRPGFNEAGSRRDRSSIRPYLRPGVDEVGPRGLL